ncbi:MULTISPECIES: hypothetical protein [unclassified Lysobacter]|uniref:hypothetical protein n=1 Tax=unclassified Lysobacter TaxID=2635362 RepID=UPI001C218C16|nr:hypothetical protein [Lysobacter sp. MMG2]MBU8977507.1 hypothetical protein [Lysobacter sp. MMG2]
MNPYQPPSAKVAQKKRTFASTVIGLGCVVFGGLLFLSSIGQLLGGSTVPHQNADEARGGMIASVLIAAASAYLVLYGLKKLKGRAAPAAADSSSAPPEA